MNQRPRNYTILTSKEARALSRQVNELIDDGWLLCGCPVASVAGREVTYSQCLIRPGVPVAPGNSEGKQ